MPSLVLVIFGFVSAFKNFLNLLLLLGKLASGDASSSRVSSSLMLPEAVDEGDAAVTYTPQLPQTATPVNDMSLKLFHLDAEN